MSLKNLFSKNKTTSYLSSNDLDKEFQSNGFVKEVTKEKERFIPDVDFLTASNFARYGSAKKYFSDAVKNIYNTFPYDGSFQEKQKWRNDSTDLEIYIFDKFYPKTTGYVTLGSASWDGSAATTGTSYGGFIYSGSSYPQYIKIIGGPRYDAINPNIYSEINNKKSNLSLEYVSGNTVEFWFKQENPTPRTYCLFDLTNRLTSSDPSYSRLTIENLNNGGFTVTYKSGSYGISRKLLATSSLPSYSINSWHHYGFVFNNSTCSLYIDGNFVTSNSGSSLITSPISQLSLLATLGSYADTPDLTVTSSTRVAIGSGSVFGSFDEFRFWKKARTENDIDINRFVHVGGGTNTDDYADDLGVYLKFNEGFVSSSAYDARILDYSGRISSGSVINYTTNIRYTGSAIESYNPNFKEPKDPIIYSVHPLVQDCLSTLEDSGEEYDYTNSTNIYSSIPAWITEETEDKEIYDLENLTQIISSYFDKLHLEIEFLTKIKNGDYPQYYGKTFHEYAKILESHDFIVSDIFTDATVLEDILSRNNDTFFDEKITNIKNLIYKNIYNNLAILMKSKGTEKSFRNLMRCMGIDESLVKINVYGQNNLFDLSLDNRNYVSIPKNYINFNSIDNFGATIYQKNAFSVAGEKSYIDYSSLSTISSTASYFFPLTVEAEVLFPKKFTPDDPLYFSTPFLTSSIYGVHSRIDEFPLQADDFNFQVYAVKADYTSKDAFFILSSSAFNGVYLTSSYFKDVYNDEKWNFAVRLKNKKYGTYSASYIDSNYDLEFYGVNTALDTVQNEFIVTASVTSASVFSGIPLNKKLYAGARLQSFSSSVLQNTDIKISSVRYWLTYLNNEIIKQHAYDASSFGSKNPLKNPIIGNKTINSILLKENDTLVLNWDFSNISSSNSSGNFNVYDASSGSTTVPVSSVFGNIHSGYGYGFVSNSQDVVDKRYVYSAKNVLPEIIANNTMVQVLNTEDLDNTIEARPSSVFFSIEKNPYQIVSEDMMTWFSSISDFNNLIGQPIDKLENNNKSLKNIKYKYFQSVGNEVDIEKFINFYKWIDSSILKMIQNLIPGTAVFSDTLSNVVESHLFERNSLEIRHNLTGSASSTNTHVRTNNTFSSTLTSNGIISDKTPSEIINNRDRRGLLS